MRRLTAQHCPLLLVLAGFVTLATIYSLATPIFEASDELWHYPYVQYLATGKGLPVLGPDPDQNVARQEGGQPPLYYLLAAAASFWIETGPTEQLVWPNPHASTGVPLALGNKNMVIHTPAEEFPYHGVSLAVHLVRLLSVALAAVAVASTYFLALALFPGRTALAAGAAAVHAFIPQFLFISGSVNNDNLGNGLSAVTLLLIVRLVVPNSGARKYDGPLAITILGVVLSLAALAKLSALGLLPLSALAIGIVAWRQRSVRFLIGNGAALAGLVVLIAGWWYFRNWLLYGDPLGLKAFLAVVGQRQMTLPELWSEMEGLKINFWGLFGGVNVLAGAWIYRLFDLLTLLASLGLMWRLARRGRSLSAGSFPQAAGLALVILWPVIIGGLLLRWTAMTMGSQGRLLFPALPSLSIFFLLGLLAWLPRRWERSAAVLVGGSMLVVAVLVPFLYIAPAYPRPKVHPATAATTVPNPVQVEFGRQIRLLGFRQDTHRLRPGEAFSLALYWQRLAALDQDYSLFIHLLGPDGRLAGQVDTYPGWGAYPTRLWGEGEVVEDAYRVEVAQDAPPGVYEVKVGFYTLSNMQRLTAIGEGGAPLGSFFTLGRIKVAPGIPTAPAPSRALGIDFEDGISLAGYDLDRTAASEGDTLHLTLYWLARNAPSRDYTVFTQLLDAEGRLWAQHDSPPQSGTYPTSYWDPGEAVVDAHPIVLPPVPPGRYRLIAGLYLNPDGTRLRRLSGESPADHVAIEEIQVRQP